MIRRHSFLLLALASVLAVPLVRADNSPGNTATPGIEAVSRPSDDRALAFVRPGRVGEIFVKEGDRITKDEVLARQDVSEEMSLLKQAQMQAADVTRVAAQDAQLQQKKADLKKIEYAVTQHSATQFELEHAQLDVTIADLSLQLAAFEHKVDVEKATQADDHIEQMTIRAPFDGLVETIISKAGEATEQNTKVIRVVNVDKLWIDVACPTSVARSLDKKSLATVVYPDRAQTAGTIIFFGAVADAASDTLLIRVEVPNTAGRPAGEHVKVIFPEAKVASKDE